MDKINRFNIWVALVAFSSVVLGTVVELVPKSDRDAKEDYVISCCSIAIILGTVMCLSYLYSNTLVGGLTETSVSIVVFALWCAAIGVIMDPDNELAIVNTGAVQTVDARYRNVIVNPNMYFFSWASFLSAACVLFSLAQHQRFCNIEMLSTKLFRWYLLVVASVVVMGSSSKIEDPICDEMSALLCRRTNYGISLGVVTSVLGIIPILIAHLGFTFPVWEGIVATVILIFYCVGVAALTGTSGPANQIGNFYFSLWIAFGLSLVLFCTYSKEICGPGDEEEEDEDSVSEAGKPKQVTNDVERQDVGQHVEEVEAKSDE